MKHARPDYDRIQDPTGLIPEDEPVFLIRGKDVAAPQAILAWADIAARLGADPSIVETARRHAVVVAQWQTQHGAKVPDLPVPA